MTPQFMGADSGRLGPPFDSGFYRPDATALNRDSSARLPRVIRAALPPVEVVRRMPPGKGPQQAAVAEMDWSDQDDGKPPAEARTVWLPDDRTLLDGGFGGDDPTAFDRMRERVTVAHGWAHRYVGGDVAREGFHDAFRDPFVFLLHSNVDRLWASWQLRQQGDSREWAWRLDGGEVYGSTATDRDLVRRMDPWSGGSLAIFPWTRAPEPRLPSDPDVVRPPLYDRYVYDDDLCASWAALLLGKRLSSGVTIRATYELDASDPGTVTIVLRLRPDERWWKGVRVPVPGGDVMIEVDNDVREAQITVPVSALAGGQLVLHRRQWIVWPFSTGKRIVHRLGDLGFLTAGSRLVLTWLA